MGNLFDLPGRITVTANINGERVQATQSVAPEILAAMPEVREQVIAELKRAVLDEAAKKIHWKIGIS